jgi:hypothetical protein
MLTRQIGLTGMHGLTSCERSTKVKARYIYPLLDIRSVSSILLVSRHPLGLTFGKGLTYLLQVQGKSYVKLKFSRNAFIPSVDVVDIPA